MQSKEKAAQMSASKNYLNLSANNSTPIDTILGALKKVCKSSKEGSWMALCPGHEDKSPSLSIRELSDGRVLIYCHAGCEPLEVLDALGLRFEDLFPKSFTNSAIAPEKRPFNPLEVLVALQDEVIRVYIIGRDMLEGRHSEESQSRLGLALERINAGIAATGGGHV